MGTVEELGLDQETLDSLSQEARDKIITGQAKLIADRQFMATEALRNDQEELIRRSRRAEDQILGRDANKCDDTPVPSEPNEEMKIHSLGDVYIGDEAIVHQRAKQQVSTDIKDSPITKQASVWPWVVGSLATGIGAAGITAYLLGGADTDTQNTLRPNNPQQIIDLDNKGQK